MPDTPQPKQSAESGSDAPICSVIAEDFVSNYADEHLYERDEPKGMCDGCEHYRRADGMSDDDDDWCWLKEGAFADGRENECPAWIASLNHSPPSHPPDCSVS